MPDRFGGCLSGCFTRSGDARPWAGCAGGPPRALCWSCATYAAVLLGRELTRSAHGAIRIESAGFAGLGRPCPPVAVEVAAALGLDLSGHRSKQLTSATVSDADLIIVMDEAQARALHALFGCDLRDVLILGDLDPEPIETRVIQDPVEQPKNVFERCYSRINRCVSQLVQAVADSTERAAPQRQPELTT